ncbi:MAG TPA: DUF4912 domain-containing protein [Symbiobacteriaceae bacterium]|jgi:hypothetical protein
MTALAFLVVIGLVFVVVWIALARNAHPRAKLGPDGTNVREPETFVVHHEGKGQGLDIANTALKERTEHLSRELPGGADKVKAPIPGRDLVRMGAPPSDISQYGSEKVAPGAVPGQPEKVASGPIPGGSGGESKEKVLMEGPKGSRPGTPEEPGSPYAKGRRVTDNHRDVEAAQELLANPYPGTNRNVEQDLAASAPTDGQEPGYGLGRTAPGETDGEGGQGTAEDANALPRTRGRVVAFRSRPGEPGRQAAPTPPASRAPGRGGAAPEPPEDPDDPDNEPGEDIDLTHPGPELSETTRATARTALHGHRPQGTGAIPPSGWNYEMAGELTLEGDGAETRKAGATKDWSALTEEIPLPDTYDADVTVALIRTPRSVYVYWDRGGGGETDLKARMGEQEYDATVPVLRLWDDGRNVRNIQVHERDDHWFVNDGLEAGRHYVFSYERRTPGGLYYRLSQSGPINLPHDWPATRTPAILVSYFGGQPGEVAGSLRR